MPFSVAPLFVLAVALPFLFSITDSPTGNFWPLLVSWVCGGGLLLVVAVQALRPGPQGVVARLGWARLLALGLAVAAAAGSFIGLIQYLVGDAGLAPWIHASTIGQAVGNLRQRNQQASLLSLGLWAILWWALHAPTWRAAPGSVVEATPRRRLLQDMAPVLAVAAMAWMGLAQAATASRTGAVQWLLVVALVVCWRRTGPGAALRLAVAALTIFVAAAWALPELLWQLQGVRADALFQRFAGDSHSCTSRRVLWSNMLTLIAQKPWLGWGWGELDYAHYVTLFPGERFCVLLDNAHNLPLHLAVELGLPAAVALCGGTLIWVLWSQPWRETQPARQLAWGVLAVIGLHSMLEYPLWYGPFQIVTLAALALLLWPRHRVVSARGAGAALGGAALVWALCALAAWDYHRVSQLYKPYADRAAAYRDDTQNKVGNPMIFRAQADFARLTTMAPTRDNAPQVNALAHQMLHYSPEPRILEILIDSALMLGKDDEAAFHMKRYRLAYQREYSRYVGGRAAKASAPG
ncbi:Wzy polymerase domain-containing protein [Acidovorax sp. LjRoot194]|uniref:Wzy polymerase domain-containing protein n=1 Tax=Acidovorax sp. LjRoot194 TaxID=3342280 RepID=UPI003ED17066